MLEAYTRLPVSLRTAHPLVLVGGKGWRSEFLHELIDKGQNAGWLRYLGFVPEEDLPALSNQMEPRASFLMYCA